MAIFIDYGDKTKFKLNLTTMLQAIIEADTNTCAVITDKEHEVFVVQRLAHGAYAGDVIGIYDLQEHKSVHYLSAQLKNGRKHQKSFVNTLNAKLPNEPVSW